MSRSTNNPWLHRFAVLTAVATLALVGIGGLVTSHEAGLAVPDWPTSYGYNPFLFPISKWWHAGNIFYEHSHRLFASGVGLLTTILAVWLWRKESRRWLRWLGIIAFLVVVLQGVLGGLRVVLLKNQLGIFHATLAQLFFVLTCAIALFTSRWWQSLRETGHAITTSSPVGKVRRWFIATTLLILFQLILGATMRHQHAGLAIPDFPFAYGKLWPATNTAAVAYYNAHRMETTGINSITAFQIILQMAHRIVAMLILAAVAFCAWSARRRFTGRSPLAKLALLWLGLILVQVGLGAATILSNKAADVATAHVLAGALSLAMGAMLSIVSFRSPESARSVSPVAGVARLPHNEGPLTAGTAAAQ